MNDVLIFSSTKEDYLWAVTCVLVASIFFLAGCILMRAAERIGRARGIVEGARKSSENTIASTAFLLGCAQMRQAEKEGYQRCEWEHTPIRLKNGWIVNRKSTKT